MKRYITVYCGKIRTRSGFFEVMRGVFPELIGSNLDALHDVLTDVNASLTFRDFERFEDETDGYVERIKKVLAACERENKRLTVKFK